MIKDGSRQPSCPVKSVGVGGRMETPCFPSERQARPSLTSERRARSCEVQASRATNCTVVAIAVQSWAGSRAAKSAHNIAVADAVTRAGGSSPRKRWCGPIFCRRVPGRGLYIWEERRVLAVHLHGVGTLGNNRPFRGQAGKSSWSTFPRLPLSWRLSGCLALLVSRLISPLASRSRRCLRLKWLNETARYIKRRARRW